MKDSRYMHFRDAIRDAVEQHLPHLTYGTAAANENAWQIAGNSAWRMWAEMERAGADRSQPKSGAQEER